MRFGTAEALVVNVKRRAPGQMVGMGDASDGSSSDSLLAALQSLGSGAVTQVSSDLQVIETEAKILVGGAIVAGLAGIWALARAFR